MHYKAKPKAHNNRNALIIIAIVLLCFGLWQYRENKYIQDQRDNAISFLNDSISYYKDKYGKEVATKTALSGDKNQLEILLSKQIDSTSELKELVRQYKHVDGAGIVNTITIIDTVYVPFNQPVGLNFNKSINLKDDYYNINAFVDQDGFGLNSLEIPNKLSFVIGQKKTGWFSKPTYSVEIKNSNPYIRTTGVDAYQFTPKIRRWSVGPYLGFDLFQQDVSAGISLQYGILRF
jgi:hypothetical protein